MYAVGNRVNDSSRSATAALGVGTNFSAAHNQYLVGTKTVTSVNGVFNFSGKPAVQSPLQIDNIS